MNRLLEVGFQLAGHWQLEGEALRLELLRFATRRNVLYAFVSDGQVMYIGKTTQSLSTRMRGYLNPSATQTTNINNNRRIKELLQIGAAAQILVLPDNGLLRYGGFHINLAAGLEDDLIRTVDPPWNGGRTEPLVEAHPERLVDSVEENAPLPAAEATFSIVLHTTYYRQGFFNVGVDHESLLGADGEPIEIYLGQDPSPVTGSINRSANKNHTPRVTGGVDLKRWFQRVASEKDRVDVEVLSPNSIRLIPRR